MDKQSEVEIRKLIKEVVSENPPHAIVTVPYDEFRGMESMCETLSNIKINLINLRESLRCLDDAELPLRATDMINKIEANQQF